ncbi:MAG TPA: YfhO family protein [Gemmatimonadales bacterium]|nr:YfhO family protein [Gemmatimonadales bacterium]
MTRFSLSARFPTLTAFGAYGVAVTLAFWPLWSGQWIINPYSDLKTGYPFRLFAAEHLRAFGEFPQWNPYIFGGMPFAANPTFGDTFYPTFLLRLVLPIDLAITLGFMAHLVMAGTFAFLFLRALKLDWGPAFVGGAAYMFTGQLLSLVTAGHDGKLFVSAWLPLALLCVHGAVARADWRRYLAFGAVVGMCLLSPHVQLTYYLLMAAGFFWLFMVVWSGDRPAHHAWWRSALLFGAGLAVGFAMDAIQLVPFVEYIRFSPRGAEAAAAGASSTGWAYATSYSMPPEELLNVVWPSFSGMVEQYWGRNALKFHSEYLGVVPMFLAAMGLGLPDRRRYAWFFACLAGYAVLFALGGHTPFYRLPYHLLPGIKMTRGAGMIFFLAAFSTAVLAAMGTQALLRSGGRVPRPVLIGGLGILGAGALLAAGGGFKGIMVSFADVSRLARIEANYPTFTLDAWRGLTAGLMAVGLIAWLRSGRVAASVWAGALGALVLVDLWSVERRQIRFGPPAREYFAADDMVRLLQAGISDSGEARLERVLPLAGYVGDNYLMIHRIRSALGYQGTELHRYDELMGGKNLWGNQGNPNLWRLLAIRYVVLDRPIQTPALEAVGSGVARTYEGDQVHVYRFTGAQPFAWLVREALQVPDGQVLPALMDPRFDARRLLLVPPDAGVGQARLAELPDATTDSVAALEERPGRYRFRLAAGASVPGYLFVSEPYYPAWRATVDGTAAPVVRAQYALMAVPVPAGAREVILEFHSTAYRTGRLITLVTLLGVVIVGLRLGRGRARSVEDA